MNSYWTLTALFIRDMVHRRSILVVVILVFVMFLLNIKVLSEFEDILSEGETYEIATQKTTKSLKGFADQIKFFGLAMVIMVSAMLAPGSRRDGTAQFLMTVSVSRFRYAAAQFSALMVFVMLATLLVHIGYVIPALHFQVISTAAVLFSWIFLLVPMALIAWVVYTFSLSHSAIMTYIVLFVIPFILLPAADGMIQELAGDRSGFPFFLTRMMENLGMFFPNVNSFLFWPDLIPQDISGGPPAMDWTWSLLHAGSAVMFWVLLGSLMYRHYSYGSRTLLK